MPKWWDYVTRVAGDVTQTEIAERTGIEQASVSRWKKGASEPSVRAVVKFATSYGRNPVEALIAADYLDADAVTIVMVERAADELSTDEILDQVNSLNRELGRRLSPRDDAPSV